MNLISLKSDYAFKELFSHENVRKQFISDILGIPLETIKSVRITNPHLWKWYRKQKQGILDVALELNDNARMDIEMQVHRQKYWIKRKLFYLAKTYTEDLKIGQDYDKLRKCISISILDFNLLNGKANHSVYTLRNKNAEELTDLFELHIIELKKEFSENNTINDWIRLFNAQKEEDLNMLAAKNAGFAEAVEVIKSMSMGKSLRYIYEQHMKAVRDRRAEDAYVRDEGIIAGKVDDILALLDEIGEIPKDLREKIQNEADINVLTLWLKIAAKADSITSFRTRCNI